MLLLVFNTRPIFRYPVSAGGVVLLLLGVAAVLKVLHEAHFEGFVVVIGMVLILEGALTPIVMLPPRQRA